MKWVGFLPAFEANDINPQQYLADVLLRVQDHPAAQIDALLPTNWTPAIA